MSITISIGEGGYDVELLYPPNVTEVGKCVLFHLLRNEDQSKYDLYGKGKVSYPAISETVDKLLEMELIRVSGKRPPEKARKKERDAKQEINLYSITQEGLKELIFWYYFKDYPNYPKGDGERIRALREIFYKIKQDHPSFLPQVLRELPSEYGVSFYPFFRAHDVFLSAFRQIIQARAEGISEFFIDNGYLRIPVDVTEIEVKIIQGYLEE